jgi:hypothetical protein
MAHVLVHVTMSPEGLIAGREDDLGWSFQCSSDPMVEQVMSEIGAVVNEP